jgi:hypothetical protein
MEELPKSLPSMSAPAPDYPPRMRLRRTNIGASTGACVDGRRQPANFQPQSGDLTKVEINLSREADR